MRARRPSLNQAIVKLNEGVSGAGNAMVDLHGLPAPGSPDEAEAIRDRLLDMQPEAKSLAVDVYLAAFEKHGGIVEERITGEALTSPSVQMRALPDGTVELLSTHDQLLGGASGQKYLGCVFPANPDYAAAIAEPAMVIGRRLAELGVLGRFAVDFVMVQDETGAWTPYAIELNLRKGGTTHPFLTLQFLTDGTYDGDRGVFLTPSGSTKYLVATDHFEDERLKALTVPELFDVVVRNGLHFDQARRTGVVFHMISCLTECGRVGLTAVGDNPEDAWRIYQEAQSVVLQEAEQALEEGCVGRLTPRPTHRRSRLVRRLRIQHARARQTAISPAERPPGRPPYLRGCRDQSPPRRDIGIHLPGASSSPESPRVWGGGIAFYSPHADGELAARAYLITFGQLSDVVAQEAGGQSAATWRWATESTADGPWWLSCLSRPFCTWTTGTGSRCSPSPPCRTSSPHRHRLPTFAPCSTGSVKRSAGAPKSGWGICCAPEASHRRGPPTGCRTVRSPPVNVEHHQAARR